MATNKDEVTLLPNFDVNGNGGVVWTSLEKNGRLPCEWEGGAVSLAFSLSRETRFRTIEMAVAWHNPRVKFPFASADANCTRRHVRWFSSAKEIITYSLANYAQWESEIDAWQNPILKDPKLPTWFKSALFNELYYVADGGAVWVDCDREMTSKLEDGDPRKEFGRFVYLESHEYIMYNTVDVHFYASASFGQLWPGLELSMMVDVAEAVPVQDKSVVWYHSSGGRLQRKYVNSVPHDLGCPGESPWEKTNAYLSHNTAEWKDLNLKFVLESYRAYSTCFPSLEQGPNQAWFLAKVWPMCLSVMRKAEDHWDKDKDGMIENDPHHPDQTYDMWVMDGPSAYCGILWVCSLFSMWKMAGVIGDEEESSKYAALMSKAVGALDAQLWNGSYYDFDSSSGDRRRTIIADQLSGLWSLLIGLESWDRASVAIEAPLSPALNRSRIASILKTVFENNVEKWMGGEMGAVNGFSPVSGRPDITAAQAEETWTGVNYALASIMLLYGMDREAFQTAKGIYTTVYDKSGLGFQTPEALTADKYYRAPGYMRPLSIWSMHTAYCLRSQAKEEAKD
ncbi:unnamed protein product [Notodromas monacha]|uniref:Non-lysosomal glucosylceramidase n=1 Tax=Notodromas monacha TaxID=399045 RepID=A0A7R9GKK0_9CRUS|nr:unnamed protein product [Notodromas monacha]CAG0923998.1 unnamed protein product [Notodromas monacha]